MMKKIIILFLVALVGGAFFWQDYWLEKSVELISPLVKLPEKPKTLEKYSFESLRQKVFIGSEIKLEKVLQEQNSYTAYLFSFRSEGKRVTGMANLPLRQAQGVVVMLRGYADEEIYFTGLGTRKAAGFFAEHGFITLAPDFLGFGGSDEASADILEARFERPVTVLNLLASIKTLPQANPERVFLWGHSNGGQIALSVLEILPARPAGGPAGRQVPATLWAPITRGFPESVLDYMGEMDDKGLKVKRAIDDFLAIYDAKKYSVDNYFSDIQAPLQLHQGLNDPLVSVEWSDQFVSKMKELGKTITYYKYPRNDHNLSQSWDLVVERDLGFFRKNLK